MLIEHKSQIHFKLEKFCSSNSDSNTGMYYSHDLDNEDILANQQRIAVYDHDVDTLQYSVPEENLI